MPAFNGSHPYLPFQKQCSIGYHVSYIAKSMLEPSKEPPPDKNYNEQSQPSKRAILCMVSHRASKKLDECADLPAWASIPNWFSLRLSGTSCCLLVAYRSFHPFFPNYRHDIVDLQYSSSWPWSRPSIRHLACPSLPSPCYPGMFSWSSGWTCRTRQRRMVLDLERDIVCSSMSLWIRSQGPRGRWRRACEGKTCRRCRESRWSLGSGSCSGECQVECRDLLRALFVL